MGVEVTFLGHRETAIGYDEAIASRFKSLLERTQRQRPEIGAVVAPMRAQFGRPPGPIWDPVPLATDRALATDEVADCERTLTSDIESLSSGAGCSGRAGRAGRCRAGRVGRGTPAPNR
jgi:hypothetical protein